MYEVRESDRDGRLTHVWFQIKTKEEAIKIMLKRIFDEHEYYHKKDDWTGCDIYWDRGNFALYQNYYNRDHYDLDNVIGPSTEFTYDICAY
jgi:hypothetical protein